MKRVEPFLADVAPPVLEYAQPDPKRTLIGRFRDAIDPAVDLVGGPGVALLIAMIFFIGVGVSFPGPVGASMVIVGGVLGRLLLHHWCKSSRW